jgi:hypothetical protein
MDYAFFLTSLGFSEDDAKEIAQTRLDFLDETFPEEDLDRRWSFVLLEFLEMKWMETL